MVGSHITLRRVGIVLGTGIWVFLWFWPWVGTLTGISYSVIDYVLRGEEMLADFFYFGVAVGFLVVYGIIREISA